MTDLKRMSDDWEYFCETVFGRTLPNWQKDIIKRLSSNGSVTTKMMLKEGLSGSSIDCVIVDDFYEKAVKEGIAECVIVKRLRDSCYLAFEDGTNDYTTAEQAADRIEALEAALREIYEVYAGSEGIPQPMTAAEGYLLRLVMEMADTARTALGEKKDG
jgi:hypothetical protein